MDLAKLSPAHRFSNTEPGGPIVPGPSVLRDALTGMRRGRPSRPVPLAASPVPEQVADIALTWYGHASAMIEVDGHRVLVDPVWSNRVSPSSLVGPARLHPVPVPLDALPPVDAVVISHDHYDHLDKATIRALARTRHMPFLVPLGVAAHLRGWGIADDRIVELDWEKGTSIGALTVTCAEARHFSGRALVRNNTLWASWVIAGPDHSVYFGGDTGYSKCFAEIAGRHGPFDATVLPIGAYDRHWRDIHMDPEEAVAAHADLNLGDPAHGVLMPIHWATFNLALHAWDEPVRRLVAAAAAAGTPIAVPRPGERVDLSDPAALFDPAHAQPWWDGIG
ncbi:MBL fold metallo-hydrolase [Aldersonia sp. NBC_00410]|uniref:MBL fold metallo-hydrolase n=1 Tax=Aldersonia sp. NBC_00410 TaxID=2975954 RepID=UPI002B1CE9D7|nr:MBL fold metallo-hydrolase [Aldersonia sp. NBC_00410]